MTRAERDELVRQALRRPPMCVRHPDGDEWLTAYQAREMLGVGPSGLLSASGRGQLRVAWPGKPPQQSMYLRSDIEAYDRYRTEAKAERMSRFKQLEGNRYKRPPKPPKPPKAKPPAAQKMPAKAPVRPKARPQRPVDPTVPVEPTKAEIEAWGNTARKHVLARNRLDVDRASGLRDLSDLERQLLAVWRVNPREAARALADVDALWPQAVR